MEQSLQAGEKQFDNPLSNPILPLHRAATEAPVLSHIFGN
jgi:hypothetical protein